MRIQILTGNDLKGLELKHERDRWLTHTEEEEEAKTHKHTHTKVQKRKRQTLTFDIHESKRRAHGRIKFI